MQIVTPFEERSIAVGMERSWRVNVVQAYGNWNLGWFPN